MEARYKAMRVTLEVPEPLFEVLRKRAVDGGVSIRSLILAALEEAYFEPRKGNRIRGPMVRGKGKLGPQFPVDENPHDLVFG
jgi:hypothetical protein